MPSDFYGPSFGYIAQKQYSLTSFAVICQTSCFLSVTSEICDLLFAKFLSDSRVECDTSACLGFKYKLTTHSIKRNCSKITRSLKT